MSTPLPEPVASYLSAGNAFDADAMIATFAPDAVVNDERREFRGVGAIRSWLDRVVVGAKVTMAVADVREHHGDVILDAVVDGEYDKTGLPDPLVLTYYFTVRDRRIVQLIILHNESVAP